jgi:hypothetical protein
LRIAAEVSRIAQVATRGQAGDESVAVAAAEIRLKGIQGREVGRRGCASDAGVAGWINPDSKSGISGVAPEISRITQAAVRIQLGDKSITITRIVCCDGPPSGS